jgi:alanine-synthesizing transaminase
MRFSSRTHWDLQETELARAMRTRQASGLPIFDLTASNPTHCGFRYDEAALLAALRGPDALVYDPDPRGILRAREAVVGYYAEADADVTPHQIFLTTSTSEAYSYLFRLLCDPGEEVLIAQPSYPLFDFLARLDDVHLVPYPLFHDHGWHLDAEALRRLVTPKTRAIALVHPNNPTGHFIKEQERREVEALCVEHGLALIVDEVFLDYPFPGHEARSFATGGHSALTFLLSGLSKIAALPQMKASWIAAFGPEPELTQALERLEVVADTFLSMNAPVQHALPEWLGGRGVMQRQILERVQANLKALDALLGEQTMVSRLEVEAGWYAVLRVPALEPDEHLAVRLIRDYGISVHPGYFFGFPSDGWLVISLMAPLEAFLAGASGICSVFSAIQEHLKDDYLS